MVLAAAVAAPAAAVLLEVRVELLLFMEFVVEGTSISMKAAATLVPKSARSPDSTRTPTKRIPVFQQVVCDDSEQFCVVNHSSPEYRVYERQIIRFVISFKRYCFNGFRLRVKGLATSTYQVLPR